MLNAKQLYEICVLEGLAIDHHGSDLYIESSPLSDDLVKEYEWAKLVTSFEIDGQLWYDVPFAYQPYWEKPLAERLATNALRAYANAMRGRHD